MKEPFGEPMLQKAALKMQKEALRAVDPYLLIKNKVHLHNGLLQIGQFEAALNKFQHIFILGFGKAVAPMARALEEILDDKIADGVLLVKYGHQQELSKIRCLQAAHPVPDQQGLQGSRELLALAKRAGKDDLVIVLISGGGSALLELLPDEISLRDIAAFNEILLSCGAHIEEMNILRKHISLIKGGQLARALSPARTVSLILSDVIADPLESIASGPTVPDTSSFSDCRKIIQKYNLNEQLPEPIKKYLQLGAEGLIPETPFPGDPIFERTQNIILGNNRLALQVLQKNATDAGYHTLILTDRLQGEAREAGNVLAAVIQSALAGTNSMKKPGCLILGGEPTVTIKGKGKGGRNQELVLALLLAMGRQTQPFYFCSLGTDGTDGPTEAAGAWIDQRSYQKALDLGLDMQSYLANNDSFHFFKKMDQLIITGPTKTNVMDIIYCLYK